MPTAIEGRPKMVCGAEGGSDMGDDILADLFILFAAWVGLTVTFFYIAEWAKIRFNQNKLHNELRYPRRHKEQ